MTDTLLSWCVETNDGLKLLFWQTAETDFLVISLSKFFSIIVFFKEVRFC